VEQLVRLRGVLIASDDGAGRIDREALCAALAQAAKDRDEG